MISKQLRMKLMTGLQYQFIVVDTVLSTHRANIVVQCQMSFGDYKEVSVVVQPVDNLTSEAGFGS